MSVRAKFKCESIVGNDQNANLKDIKLVAVIDGSAENKAFFKWTPSGQISVSCVNPEANKQFEIGKEYYVDFTPA